MYLNVEQAHIYMYPGYINLKMQQFVSLSVMTSFNITYITCPSDKLNVTHTHDLTVSLVDLMQHKLPVPVSQVDLMLHTLPVIQIDL